MDWNFEEALDYYGRQGAPGDQNALVNLLKEIQKEEGGVSLQKITAIAERYSIRQTLLLAIVKRYPSLRMKDTHCLEVCSGIHCSKRGKLASFVEKTYGSSPREFELKYVNCMRMCGKGPNIKWDGEIFHGADENLIRRLVEGKKSGKGEST